MSDLDVDPDEEDRFRRLLDGHAVRAYHATRLLPHEVEGIRNEGLHRLDADLIQKRLESAAALGVLTDVQANRLRESHMLTGIDTGRREGQVCLFLSRSTFEEEHGLWRLFATWGGEAIYFGAGRGTDLSSHLLTIGEPALVVAALDDLHQGWRVHYVAPGLARAFVAAFLGLDDQGADIHYLSSIASSAIEDVWQPGYPSFDHHLPWVDYGGR